MGAAAGISIFPPLVYLWEILSTLPHEAQVSMVVGEDWLGVCGPQQQTPMRAATLKQTTSGSSPFFNWTFRIVPHCAGFISASRSQHSLAL